MKTTDQNNDDMRFRFAERSDVPSIITLLADDPIGASREQANGPDMSVYFDAFEEMTAQGGNAYLLAIERDDTIVGCVQITLIPGLSRSGTKRAQLEGIRVAESARGQGVGRRMMEEAHEIARQQGCGLVQLTSDQARTDALRFYTSMGYVNSHCGLKCAL